MVNFIIPTQNQEWWNSVKPFSLDVELSCLVGWVSYPARTCQHSWCTLYFLVSTPNQSHVCFPPQIQIFQYLCLKKKNTQKVLSFLEFRWFFCCSISLGAKFFGFLVSLWKSDQVSSPHPRYLFKIKFSMNLNFISEFDITFLSLSLSQKIYKFRFKFKL